MTTTPAATSPPRKRIVIVGGVAGGMSAAARARRLDEHAEIVVLEQGEYVSFANCGLPYQLSGEISSREDLLLHTPESLRRTLNLDVRTGHRVTSIDRQHREVTATSAGGTERFTYDALILAPGAVAVRPPIDGLDHPAVHSLRTIPDLDAVQERVTSLLADRESGSSTPHAVVIGAGFIGLEAVEALTGRGLQVHLVELADHVLPPLDAELAPLLATELTKHGVDLHLGVSAEAVTDTADGTTVSLSDSTVVPADLVLVNVGVRPASTLAEEAGLELSARGAIRVDGDQRTSDPHIWAVGDAVEIRHAVTGSLGTVPLAGPANRQGRRAADSINGHRTTRQRDVLGTAIVRVFGLTAAVTGANQSTLRSSGIEHEVARVHAGHHAGYFPGAEQLHLVASFAPDGRLLGAQGVGRDGVDKRIDVLATALRAEMTADDLAELELAYAPPYGSAKDAVNMLGFVAQNVLDGTMPQWHPEELEQVRAHSLVLDVRSAEEYATGHLDGALHLPHTELRDRLDEVRAAARVRSVAVLCASGVRSYLATRILRGAGVEARNLSGGWNTLRSLQTAPAPSLAPRVVQRPRRPAEPPDLSNRAAAPPLTPQPDAAAPRAAPG